MKKTVKKPPRSRQTGTKKKEKSKAAGSVANKATGRTANKRADNAACSGKPDPQKLRKKSAGKKMIIRILGICGSAGLIIFLILVIWQPVFPSSWIIKKMAESIKTDNLQMNFPVVVSFNLDGKGGGVYSIVVNRDGAVIVDGMTGQPDLILFMEAKEFNRMIIDLGTGKAGKFTLINLALSNVLRYAGDITVLEKLFKVDR